MIEVFAAVLLVIRGSAAPALGGVFRADPSVGSEGSKSEVSAAGGSLGTNVNVLREVTDDMWPLGLVTQYMGFSFLPPAPASRRKMCWEKLTHGNGLIGNAARGS